LFNIYLGAYENQTHVTMIPFICTNFHHHYLRSPVKSRMAVANAFVTKLIIMPLAYFETIVTSAELFLCIDPRLTNGHSQISILSQTHTVY